MGARGTGWQARWMRGAGRPAGASGRKGRPAGGAVMRSVHACVHATRVRETCVHARGSVCTCAQEQLWGVGLEFICVRVGWRVSVRTDVWGVFPITQTKAEGTHTHTHQYPAEARAGPLLGLQAEGEPPGLVGISQAHHGSRDRVTLLATPHWWPLRAIETVTSTEKPLSCPTANCKAWHGSVPGVRQPLPARPVGTGGIGDHSRPHPSAEGRGGGPPAWGSGRSRDVPLEEKWPLRPSVPPRPLSGMGFCVPHVPRRGGMLGKGGLACLRDPSPVCPAQPVGHWPGGSNTPSQGGLAWGAAQ